MFLMMTFCACIPSVNGRTMSFTKHLVDCSIKIQRVWRQSFKFYTTKKLIPLVLKHCKRRSQIDGMRYGKKHFIMCWMQ